MGRDVDVYETRDSRPSLDPHDCVGRLWGGQTQQERQEKTQTTSSQNAAAPVRTDRMIIVYFSATGHTKRLAETTARALGAELQEIQPKKPYSKHDLDYKDKTARATIEQNDPSARPAIAGKLEGLDRADPVIIAYPIWWAQEPRIIDTFAETDELNGKKIVAICTSGGSDIAQTGEAVAALAKGSAYKGGKRFASDASEQEIPSWFREIGVMK